MKVDIINLLYVNYMPSYWYRWGKAAENVAMSFNQKLSISGSPSIFKSLTPVMKLLTFLGRLITTFILISLSYINLSSNTFNYNTALYSSLLTGPSPQEVPQLVLCRWNEHQAFVEDSISPYRHIHCHRRYLMS